MGVLPKGVLINLRTRNFVHGITSLRARRAHSRHRARNLSSSLDISAAFIKGKKPTAIMVIHMLFC